MLIVGMLAWAARYVLFAYGNAQEMVWMFYGGILLHGICYDFFFVTGQIHVDNTAPPAVRASAQGFIALITYGVGMLIGAKVSGAVVDAYTLSASGASTKTYDWAHIWLAPAIMSAVVALLFAFLFKAPPRKG
jgi:MFS family permease